MHKRVIGLCLAITLILGLVAAPIFSKPAAAAGESVSIWVTTGDQSKLLQPQTNVNFGPDSGSNPVTIDVNEATTYQTIDGFGASFTDSSAWLVWNRLSTSQRNTLMNNLFNPTTGIGLSYLRQPMGASDFALSDYTYDDTCCNLNDFSISHDSAYIIPVLQQARQINPNIKIMGSPWSAPAWMKNNNSLITGKLNTSYYSMYADYFVKYVQAYGAQGLPIDAITVQNEPLFEPGGYPGMRMEATEQADFIKNHLGPKFAVAGITTKIIAYDHNWDQPNYPITVLNDAAARNYIAGSAFHCYAGQVGAQQQVRDAYPTKGIWFTECSGGAWAPNFADNLKWDMQNLIIGSTRNWAKSVVKWNMALDSNHGPTNGGCTDCRGVVTINQSNGAVTYEVEYYALGHASKFVVPGAVRIASNTYSGGIENVAFRNPDGSKVLVVINMGGSSSTFKVRWGGQSFSYTLPAGAAATFKWSGAVGPTSTPTRTPTSGPTATPTRTPTPGPTATRTPTPIPGTYYRIDSREAAKSLDVKDVSTGDGAAIQLWTYSSGANQQFEFRPISGTSYFQIVARHSGKCLDVANVSTADGASIQQWTCQAANQNQHFSWQAVSGTSYYRIVARHSGKCLDVRDHNTNNGALIQQWACGTGLNQQWSRIQVP